MKLRNLIIYTVLLASVVLFSSCMAASANAQPTPVKTNTETLAPTTKPIPTPTPKPTPITITLAAVGDAMVHESQMVYDYDAREDVYNFLPSILEIKPNIEVADFAIANLETTISGEHLGYTGYPEFNSPESFVHALKAIGIDLVTLANNHALDYSMQGIENTLATLDRLGLDNTGVNATQEDFETYYIKNVNGIKVGVVAYAYKTSKLNRLPGYVQRLWKDKAQVKADIKNIRALGADVVVLTFHWGTEFEREHSSAHQALAKEYIAAGADIILGHHPHVVQSIEKLTVQDEDGHLREGMVAYSLGNFVNNQRSRYFHAGIVLYVPITKNIDGTVSLGDLTYVPTLIRHTRIYWSDADDHRVLPAGAYLSDPQLFDSLDNWYKRDQENIKNAYNDVVEIISEDVATPIDGQYISYPYEIYVSPADQARRDSQ